MGPEGTRIIFNNYLQESAILLRDTRFNYLFSVISYYYNIL